MSELVLKDVRQYSQDRLLFSEAPKWQDLGTAPRDGTWFLGWAPMTVEWCDISGCGPVRFCQWSEEKGHFVSSDNVALYRNELLAWAPFPTPPLEAQLLLLDGETGGVIDEPEGVQL